MTQLSPSSDNKDGKKPTDWGRVFIKLMADAHMSYESILDRTFPQIEAILNSFSDESNDEAETARPTKEHTVNDGMRFAALFK